MKLLVAITLLLSMIHQVAASEDRRSRTNPEPWQYQIHVSDPTTSTVTEESFNLIPLEVYSFYKEELESQNTKVEINLFWETPYFSAWVVEKEPSFYSINFWGGMARIPGMNDNGHAFIACHEIGHLLGGEPRTSNKLFLWASSEGQADYFASSVCLKKYFNYMFDEGLIYEKTVDPILFDKCTKYSYDFKEHVICTNIMEAVEGFKSVLEHLDYHHDRVSYSKIEKTALKTITDSYPTPQCRIETIIAGAFCAPKDFPCTEAHNKRPGCWYQN